MSRITPVAYGIVVNMKVAFNYMGEEILKELIVCMIRPRFEYAKKEF